MIKFDKKLKICFAALFFCLLCLLNPTSVWAGEFSGGYPLEGVVIFSRHNLRAPLKVAELRELSPHPWREWNAPGELTPKGGELETIMGGYFRQWLEIEGLVPQNYVPRPGEVRLYANSAQRTVATAEYFGAGLFSAANVAVEYLKPMGTYDPVFKYQVPENPALRQIAEAEFAAHGGESAACAALKKPAGCLAKVLDFPRSAYAQSHGITSFDLSSYKIYEGEKFTLKASFQPAKVAADALVLAYYEDGSALGQKLRIRDWHKIAAFNEVGINALLAMPTLSQRAGLETLRALRQELSSDKRKISYMCGHDINLAAIFSALEVQDYRLPRAIETKTPIGGKFVMEKRRGKDGKIYVALNFVYAAAEDMVAETKLSPARPPQKVRLHFKNLSENEDGLAALDDVLSKFDTAIAAGEKFK